MDRAGEGIHLGVGELHSVEADRSEAQAGCMKRAKGSRKEPPPIQFRVTFAPPSPEAEARSVRALRILLRQDLADAEATGDIALANQIARELPRVQNEACAVAKTD
jgi:hypothetical protein